MGEPARPAKRKSVLDSNFRPECAARSPTRPICREETRRRRWQATEHVEQSRAVTARTGGEMRGGRDPRWSRCRDGAPRGTPGSGTWDVRSTRSEPEARDRPPGPPIPGRVPGGARPTSEAQPSATRGKLEGDAARARARGELIGSGAPTKTSTSGRTGHPPSPRELVPAGGSPEAASARAGDRAARRPGAEAASPLPRSIPGAFEQRRRERSPRSRGGWTAIGRISGRGPAGTARASPEQRRRAASGGGCDGHSLGGRRAPETPCRVSPPRVSTIVARWRRKPDSDVDEDWDDLPGGREPRSDAGSKASPPRTKTSERPWRDVRADCPAARWACAGALRRVSDAGRRSRTRRVARASRVPRSRSATVTTWTNSRAARPASRSPAAQASRFPPAMRSPRRDPYRRFAEEDTVLSAEASASGADPRAVHAAKTAALAVPVEARGRRRGRRATRRWTRRSRRAAHMAAASWRDGCSPSAAQGARDSREVPDAAAETLAVGVGHSTPRSSRHMSPLAGTRRPADGGLRRRLRGLARRSIRPKMGRVMPPSELRSGKRGGAAHHARGGGAQGERGRFPRHSG